MDHEVLHRRTRGARASTRSSTGSSAALFQPFFHIYFRMSRIGREHIPAEGPVIIAANHRSFLDPFVIATMARRPMYYVAKKELFRQPLAGLDPERARRVPGRPRGAATRRSIETAKAILARGDIVLIFPEGTRIRPGSLGQPKRGVGRLALETGAPVVPVAVIGTEAVRRGWRIRPHKVRIRAGRPLRFPHVENASPALAGAVTDRIWPCVMLQWEWLGGLPPIRRAAIIGAGTWGTSLAVCARPRRLRGRSRLPHRTSRPQRSRAARENDALPARRRAARRRSRVVRAAELELGGARPRLPRRAGPRAARACSPPTASGSRAAPACSCSPRASCRRSGRCRRRSPPSAAPPARSPCSAGPPTPPRRSSTAPRSCSPRSTAASPGSSPTRSAPPASTSRSTTDVTGVELAGCAKNAAALAAAAAAQSAGPNVAGAAAGKVFAEVDALARARGGHGRRRSPGWPAPATWSRPSSRRARATAAPASCSRRASRRTEIGSALGQAAEAVDSVPLLATVARDAQRRRAGARAAWPRSSRAGSSPSAGPRRSPSPPGSSDSDTVRAA